MAVSWKRVLKLTSLIFLLVLSGCNQSRPVGTYDFHIYTIDTRSMLGLLAEMDGKAFVAGDEISNRRVRIMQDNTSPGVLFDQLVTHEGLSSHGLNGITVVASQCRIQQGLGASRLSFSNKQQSFSFTAGIATTHVTDYLAEIAKKQIDYDMPAKMSSISLQLREKPIDDILSAIMLADGLEAKNSSAALKLQSADYRHCANRPLIQSTKYDGRYSFSQGRGMACVSERDGHIASRLCEPAEEFDLSQIYLLGFVQKHGAGLNRKLVLETPEGVMLLSPGNAFGKHNGQIIDITESGVRLRELIRKNDQYIASERFLKFPQ